MALDFDLARFDEVLTTDSVGRRLVYRESVGSTMDVAREELAGGAPGGTVVLAEEQTAGRGRRGRGFHSPVGENLYFTLILTLPGEQHRRLPVALALAVCEATAAEGVDARIKWPNDIWVGGRKLSGMLIDAELTGEAFVAFAGVGVNVNGDPTTIPELRDIATSVRREAGRPIDREALLARVCGKLEELLTCAGDDLMRRYRARSLVLGQAVTVHPTSGEAFDGLAVEIDGQGALVVELAGGRRETVQAADVSVRPMR
jgi:BirA family transcriptional regulator, biotin operon repressor / biotin---[acetyl-CoA-carboxylase] ligase